MAATGFHPGLLVLDPSGFRWASKMPERLKAYSVGHRPKAAIDIEMFSLKG
jgi:hypothetical protein